MNGTCLKSVSKTLTFTSFRDFQLFQHPAKIQHPAKWPILDSENYQKSAWNIFLALTGPKIDFELPCRFESQIDTK